MQRPRDPYLWVWLLLALATGLTFWLGQGAGPLGLGSVALVLALAGLKGWLVVDVFMGLRQAPRLWRRLLLGWLFGLCGLLLGLYAWAG